MSTAQWPSEVEKALKRNKKFRFAKYYQLATVTPEGRPAVRTVVFRGFHHDTGISFCTDRRSQKVPQIQQQQAAEICW